MPLQDIKPCTFYCPSIGNNNMADAQTFEEGETTHGPQVSYENRS